MRIIDKLRDRGINVITQDMICSTELDRIARLFKTYVLELWQKDNGSIRYLIDERQARGIIYLVAFGCGSLMPLWVI